jgi:hypothetical protein
MNLPDIAFFGFILGFAGIVVFCIFLAGFGSIGPL